MRGKYEEWLTPDNLTCIEGWARDGLTDEQIAHNMGVSVKTLYEWKNKHVPIRDALKRGKAPVDYEVENALFKSAIGFTVKVTKPIKVKKRVFQGKGYTEEEEIQFVEEEQYIPPNTTAQIFWLKNRRPDKWRDRVENKIVAQDVEDLSPLTELLQDE